MYSNAPPQSAGTMTDMGPRPGGKRRLRIPRPSSRAGRRDLALLQTWVQFADSANEFQAARETGRIHAAAKAAEALEAAVPALAEALVAVWEARLRTSGEKVEASAHLAGPEAVKME